MIEGSLRQKTMLFMMERRLTIDEAAAVLKLLEADQKCGYLAGRWDMPADTFDYPVHESIAILVRGKVLAWMDKYREGHKARAMFTGES